MPVYSPPLRDFEFLIDDFIPYFEVNQNSKSEFSNYEDAKPILEGFGKFASEILTPLNAQGDLHGNKWSVNGVETAPGFKDAFAQFAEGGWCSLGYDEEYGGMPVPHTIQNMFEEMMFSSNLAFAMFTTLSYGQYVALKHFATEEVKKIYAPKLASGEWCGTMCLTEPQAGTDLNLLRTKARKNDDGTYDISGEKIFISAGEHDFSENITHLVLAKLEGDENPNGAISLFLVPKFKVDAAGNLGEFNNVTCTAIEHKMGIKASPTCALRFENSKGILIGEINKGLRAMFAMMNTARLSVGIQGLGLAEVSHQNAIIYANDRLQGRSKSPSRANETVTIKEHPDVKRMLMTQASWLQGMRALSTLVALKMDAESSSNTGAKNSEASQFIAFAIPVIKALFTDMGFEITNLGVQIYGGHGFIRDHGMEQFVRDSRITQLYEGTNGVQAQDLVYRKILNNEYDLDFAIISEINSFVRGGISHNCPKKYRLALEKVLKSFEIVTENLRRLYLEEPAAVEVYAVSYLRLFGILLISYCWCVMIDIANAKIGQGKNAEIYRKKIALGEFYLTAITPTTNAIVATINGHHKCVLDFDFSI